MISAPHGPVMVGVDGTEAATRAAVYGAWEARRLRVPLCLVYAFRSLVPMFGPASILAEFRTWEQDNAQAVFAKAQQHEAGEPADQPVQTAALEGSPAGVLVAESRRASLVVVASGAHGGLTGHLNDSVAAQVAAHASAPVVVLRPTDDPDHAAELSRPGPVVVGIDGSTQSHAALAFAVEEALARQTSVRVVFAWTYLTVNGVGPIRPEYLTDQEESEKALRLLAEATTGWAERYPDLAIQRDVVHDPHPVRALTEASKNAALIVVGSRGGGGFLGLRLGSTVDGLVRHSHAPVAVIRDEYPGRP